MRVSSYNNRFVTLRSIARTALHKASSVRRNTAQDKKTKEKNMGLFGDLLSLPFKVVGGVVESAGEITGTKKLTNIVSKPLDAAGDALEEIDED
jgi:hypothetical protein